MGVGVLWFNSVPVHRNTFIMHEYLYNVTIYLPWFNRFYLPEHVEEIANGHYLYLGL